VNIEMIERHYQKELEADIESSIEYFNQLRRDKLGTSYGEKRIASRQWGEVVCELLKQRTKITEERLYCVLNTNPITYIGFQKQCVCGHISKNSVGYMNGFEDIILGNICEESLKMYLNAYMNN